jgi:ubiquinone biosynthesis protein Coq4
MIVFGSASCYHPNGTTHTIYWLFTGTSSITSGEINSDYILGALVNIALTQIHLLSNGGWLVMIPAGG